MDRKQAYKQSQNIIASIQKKIMGQSEVIEHIICCFLAKGHILLTGAPGLAKTLIVKQFSQVLNLNFGRIQYTPDLLPSDITGSEIIRLKAMDSHNQSAVHQFEFVKGPLFANLVLADEINRTSPRTQAAMLESMEERSVTYQGKHYDLPSPFMVCATQNPFESEGTYPLPEAQLDRFLIHSLMDYPSHHEELNMLKAYHHQDVSISQNPDPLSTKAIEAMIHHAHDTSLTDEILELICSLVRSTRQPLEDHLSDPRFNDPVRFGSGPRGGLALAMTTKSLAFLQGDDEVRWHHVKQLVCPVLRHRICLHPRYHRTIGGVDAFLQACVSRLEDKHNLKLALLSSPSSR